MALADGRQGFVWGKLLSERKDTTKPSEDTNVAVGVYPKGHQPGDTFKDCDDCPEIVVIPSGQFRMRDLRGGGHDGEKPVHDVRIDYSFAVGKFEVTQA